MRVSLASAALSMLLVLTASAEVPRVDPARTESAGTFDDRSAPSTYQYDDGGAELFRGVGSLTTWERCFMQRFDAVGGADLLKGVSVYWHTSIANGRTARLVIFQDRVGNGDPADRVLVAERNVLVTNSGGIAAYTLTPPVPVSGVFFVGFSLVGSTGDFPVAYDTTTAYVNGRGFTSTTGVVPLDLSTAAFISTESVGFPHNMMIRATGSGGSFSFRPSGTAISPGATLIASWSDGKPLVVVGPKINRVDLGFFPVSSDALASLWASNTDGVKLLVNSLLYVMRPKVLLLGADTSPFVADVQAKLRATNLFSAVDSFDVVASTPTLNTLQAYDAVLTWSIVGYADSVALGNVLADYVDAGGGVVAGAFVNALVDFQYYPRGRWALGYEIIPPVGALLSNAASLGTLDYSTHPMLAGVSTLSASAAYRPVSTTLRPEGFRIAAWNDGKPLVAASTRLPNRVDLGMYPPSSTVNATLWDASTGVGRLMANALMHTIRPYVALVASDSLVSDVVTKLTASRRFSGVVSFNAGASTPSSASLRPFGAVATWSTAGYNNRSALGNTLADYVDAGGGVVTAIWSNTVLTSPTGRWTTGGYEITPSPLPGWISFNPALLGTVVEPSHQIASFVRKFNGGTGSFRQDATPLLRGRTIMRWSDGMMLASVHNSKKRADLGYWPVSDTAANGANPRTDVTWMTANALEFVVRVKPCPGDLSGDGLVDDTDFVLFADYYNALIDPRGDLNGDGNTDDSDFVLFANGYNELTCP